MSTVMGRVYFSHSTNADIDYWGLQKALNKFTWSDTQLDAKWMHSEHDGKMKFEHAVMEDPSGFPKIYIAEIDDPESDARFKKNAQEMTDDDHDNLVELNGDHADLKQFANEIKPFIRCGSIQISCDASDQKGLHYWEQITVNSNGSGLASWEINRANGEIVTGTENF